LEAESIAVHEEVNMKETAVNPIGTLKKWHGHWHLAVRQRDQPKKWTQGNGGSQMKLAATCRGMTHRAIPTWCKRYGCQGQGQENVERGIT
jgi:hypothetical protein